MSHDTNVAAFVLAGGASRRMGRDKALLQLNDVPMIVRTVRVLGSVVSTVAVVAPSERYASLELRVVDDRWPGEGPLGGIITALGTSWLKWNLIVACDLPFVTAEWIEWLASRAQTSPAQAIVPESTRGIEPLGAIYHRDCAPAFVTAFERGVKSIREALKDISLERVTRDVWSIHGTPDVLLRNMNTLKDFDDIQRRVSETPN